MGRRCSRLGTAIWSTRITEVSVETSSSVWWSEHTRQIQKFLFDSQQLMACLQLQRFRKTPRSPKRGADGKPEDQNYSSVATAKIYRGYHAEKATVDLMSFVKNLFPRGNPLCVTYFDEAHELGLSFWILLRLLQAQEPSTRMWYVFMGTKSSISYYAPTPENREPSLRLIQPCLTSLCRAFSETPRYS